jgi:mono/diheme cytochrome c family protein
MIKAWIRRVVIGLIVILVIIQLMPYGRDHTNPPGRAEPAWDSPRTRELAARACFDCHSNETIWPWYSNIAPVSWLIEWDVKKGREELNLSEWNRSQKEARESASAVRKGSMPPWYYPWAGFSFRRTTRPHPGAGTHARDQKSGKTKQARRKMIGP